MAGAALPFLGTARLRLRPRTLDDLEACFRMDREPGTLDWIDWPLPEGGWDDEAAHRALIRSRTLHPYPPGLGYWAVARREWPDEFLGWVLLIPENAEGPEIEIGWRLMRAARGMGYATEAAAALVRHGFETLALHRMVAGMYRANGPSNAVARRLGFRPHDDPARSGPDFVLWVLDREDWPAKRR
ncbi:MAG TPA: GNAT family N-acetyltransferase [Thermohalobaculum sp.]|nr:GNAT family N-acetyltransferase [Thermohalobaculum sp.]